MCKQVNVIETEVVSIDSKKDIVVSLTELEDVADSKRIDIRWFRLYGGKDNQKKSTQKGMSFDACSLLSVIDALIRMYVKITGEPYIHEGARKYFSE